MPMYSIIAEVQQTRAYSVMAESVDQAEEILRAEFEYMDFDVLETTLDSTTIEEID